MKVYHLYILDKRGNYLVDMFFTTLDLAKQWQKFFAEVFVGRIESSDLFEVQVFDKSPDEHVFETVPVEAEEIEL